MAWRIEFLPQAAKDLAKLDPQSSRRILTFLSERVATAKSPRTLGAALKGSRLGEFWKYRVGDYRVIVTIKDREVMVLVVRVANRREVYR